MTVASTPGIASGGVDRVGNVGQRVTAARGGDVEALPAE